MRPRARWIWAVAMVVGVAAAASSAVPFFSNAIRITVRDDLWKVVDLGKVGTEAMGLTVAWGMLSAGLGVYLSILLVWAGWGWWGGRAWAPWATWAYVTCGPVVTFTDLVIFLGLGKRNAVLQRLLFFDTLGLAVPLALGTWLILRRRGEHELPPEPVRPPDWPAPPRRPGLGWFLIAAGLIGVATGAVPYLLSGLHVVLGRDPWAAPDVLMHGVRGLGLGMDWCMLSSAMGVYLGGAMIWSGWGWLRGRPWAILASWVYVACGLTVNVTDMTIFLFRARPGDMRTRMLLADGVALLIPLLLGAWLARTGSGRPRGASASSQAKDGRSE